MTADMMPKVRPKTTERNVAQTASFSVLGKREAISSATGSLVV